MKTAKHSALADKIGQRIGQERKKRGWTLSEASTRTGLTVSPSLWVRYEGGTEPGVTKFFLIAMTLGIDPFELLPQEIRALLGKEDGALRLAEMLK